MRGRVYFLSKLWCCACGETKHENLVVLSKIKEPTLETSAFLSYALHGCGGTVSVEN